MLQDLLIIYIHHSVSDQMKVVNEQVKNMSDDDMTAMLESMANIGPEEEARMRAMGADPEMMKK